VNPFPPDLQRLALLSLVCSLLTAMPGKVWAAPPPAAEIVSLEGKGEYREPQQLDWRAAKLKQQLFPSYFVRTGDLSKMALLFVDRTQVRLAQNSVLQIKEVSQGADQKTILHLNQGRSWMQSKTVPGGLIMETPSALAAIRGTDWEIVVDDEGRATLTVFSGEVDFYNDFGRVVVARNEQARAEKGRAPVKLQIVNPRERIQWVSSLTINPKRYRELSAGGEPKSDTMRELVTVVELIDEQRLDLAFERLRNMVADARTDSPVARLLLADFLVYNGDLSQGSQALLEAMKKYPADERIDVALARIALLNDDVSSARQHVQAALAKTPQSLEAHLALGDIARLEGDAKQASAAYAQAAAIAPNDARPWLGLGMVDAERENIAAARGHFVKATTLDQSSADAWSETATLESAGGDTARALQAFEKALALQPDNYIMLTGKGLLELKQGHDEAALDTLLRASLIEPRYARAHLYQAVAYYRMGRADRALQELEKVTELDRNDPLPHLLASLMHTDAIEPAAAVQEAREAVRLMPYLKSLNQVANNQAGAANLGNAMAFFGMEGWARHMAQESYLPFWAGSHLFLADRYPGDFNRRSELLQGFLADPVVFGASNRYQSLVQEPGNYATVSLRHNHSDDLKLTEPVVTLNGYTLAPVPVAYFFEAIDTHITPGNTALDADARTFTAALGIKPRWDMGYFIYANRLSADVDIGTRDVTGVFQRVSGYTGRVDAGGHFAFDASSQVWFKAGYGKERSTVDQAASIVLPGQSLAQLSNFVTSPRAQDAQVRHTVVLSENREVTWGVEAARLETPRNLFQDTGFHFLDPSAQQNSLDATDRDRSNLAYASTRIVAGPWRFEALLGLSDYEKDRDFHVVTKSPIAATRDLAESYRRKNANGAAGVVYRFQADRLGRLACQDWTRPASLSTLAPVAIAGVVLDDQLVFAGGKTSRCRGQFEWEASNTTFVSLSADHQRISNLVSPLDGVLNTRADVTNLDRLRNRVLPLPPKPDALEDVPVFSEGKVSTAALTLEHIVTASLAARVNYAYTDSANTGSAFLDNRIPYLARYQASVGATWTWAARSYVSTDAVYRSARFSDEANLNRLDPGWDLQLRGYLEFDRKHWAVEAYALNLLKKNASDVFGVILSYRF
jgi:tetratricopeptide (TPR) repeat protein